MKIRENSPVFSAGGGEKESFLNAPEHSMLLNKTYPQEKLFCQSLTYWSFIRDYATRGKGNTQLQLHLEFQVREGRCTPPTHLQSLWPSGTTYKGEKTKLRSLCEVQSSGAQTH